MKTITVTEAQFEELFDNEGVTHTWEENDILPEGEYSEGREVVLSITTEEGVFEIKAWEYADGFNEPNDNQVEVTNNSELANIYVLLEDGEVLNMVDNLVELVPAVQDSLY